MLDKNTPHQVSGDAGKMRAVFPIRAALIDQFQVRLVHEGGRLQSVVGAFVPQIFGRAPAQVFIDKGHEPGRRVGVARTPFLEDLRDCLWMGDAHFGEPILSLSQGAAELFSEACPF